MDDSTLESIFYQHGLDPDDIPDNIPASNLFRQTTVGLPSSKDGSLILLRYSFNGRDKYFVFIVDGKLGANGHKLTIKQPNSNVSKVYIGHTYYFNPSRYSLRKTKMISAQITVNQPVDIAFVGGIASGNFVGTGQSSYGGTGNDKGNSGLRKKEDNSPTLTPPNGWSKSSIPKLDGSRKDCSKGRINYDIVPANADWSTFVNMTRADPNKRWGDYEDEYEDDDDKDNNNVTVPPVVATPPSSIINLPNTNIKSPTRLSNTTNTSNPVVEVTTKPLSSMDRRDSNTNKPEQPSQRNIINTVQLPLITPPVQSTPTQPSVQSTSPAVLPPPIQSTPTQPSVQSTSPVVLPPPVQSTLTQPSVQSASPAVPLFNPSLINPVGVSTDPSQFFQSSTLLPPPTSFFNQIDSNNFIGRLTDTSQTDQLNLSSPASTAVNSTIPPPVLPPPINQSESSFGTLSIVNSELVYQTYQAEMDVSHDPRYDMYGVPIRPKVSPPDRFSLIVPANGIPSDILPQIGDFGTVLRHDNPVWKQYVDRISLCNNSKMAKTSSSGCHKKHRYTLNKLNDMELQADSQLTLLFDDQSVVTGWFLHILLALFYPQPVFLLKLGSKIFAYVGFIGYTKMDYTAKKTFGSNPPLVAGFWLDLRPYFDTVDSDTGIRYPVIRSFFYLGEKFLFPKKAVIPESKVGLMDRLFGSTSTINTQSITSIQGPPDYSQWYHPKDIDGASLADHIGYILDISNYLDGAPDSTNVLGVNQRHYGIKTYVGKNPDGTHKWTGQQQLQPNSNNDELNQSSIPINYSHGNLLSPIKQGGNNGAILTNSSKSTPQQPNLLTTTPTIAIPNNVQLPSGGTRTQPGGMGELIPSTSSSSGTTTPNSVNSNGSSDLTNGYSNNLCQDSPYKTMANPDINYWNNSKQQLDHAIITLYHHCVNNGTAISGTGTVNMNKLVAELTNYWNNLFNHTYVLGRLNDLAKQGTKPTRWISLKIITIVSILGQMEPSSLYQALYDIVSDSYLDNDANAPYNNDQLTSMATAMANTYGIQFAILLMAWHVDLELVRMNFPDHYKVNLWTKVNKNDNREYAIWLSWRYCTIKSVDPNVNLLIHIWGKPKDPPIYKNKITKVADLEDAFDAMATELTGVNIVDYISSLVQFNEALISEQSPNFVDFLQQIVLWGEQNMKPTTHISQYPYFIRIFMAFYYFYKTPENVQEYISVFFRNKLDKTNDKTMNFLLNCRIEGNHHWSDVFNQLANYLSNESGVSSSVQGLSNLMGLERQVQNNSTLLIQWILLWMISPSMLFNLTKLDGFNPINVLFINGQEEWSNRIMLYMNNMINF